MREKSAATTTVGSRSVQPPALEGVKKKKREPENAKGEIKRRGDTRVRVKEG